MVMVMVIHRCFFQWRNVNNSRHRWMVQWDVPHMISRMAQRASFRVILATRLWEVNSEVAFLLHSGMGSLRSVVVSYNFKKKNIIQINFKYSMPSSVLDTSKIRANTQKGLLLKPQGSSGSIILKLQCSSNLFCSCKLRTFAQNHWWYHRASNMYERRSDVGYELSCWM